MTALLAIVGVLAALQGPGTLVIRSGDEAMPLAVVSTQRGPMVRIEDGLQALGAALVRSAGDRYRIVVGGAELDLTLGVSVARTRSGVEPLGAPPTVFEGRLLVPLTLLTDVIPRVAGGFTYHPAAAELRRRGAGGPSGTAAGPPPARSVPSLARVPAARREPTARVVVIDAGHGGPDRGMKGPIGSRRKLHEADITLGVARRVRDALGRRGTRVIMTRTTDTLIALADRGAIANRAQANVFVSIHVNAANPRWRNPAGARGFETYFLSEAKTDDERRVEAMENDVVRYEADQGIETGDPLAFILADMKQNEYLRESSDFAEVVQESLAGLPHPGPNRGVKQAGFRVLVTAYMPAVLVEIGFGTNPAEAAWLASPSGQVRIANAIADAIETYLERLERKTQAGSR